MNDFEAAKVLIDLSCAMVPATRINTTANLNTTSNVNEDDIDLTKTNIVELNGNHHG